MYTLLWQFFWMSFSVGQDDILQCWQLTIYSHFSHQQNIQTILTNSWCMTEFDSLHLCHKRLETATLLSIFLNVVAFSFIYFSTPVSGSFCVLTDNHHCIIRELKCCSSDIHYPYGDSWSILAAKVWVFGLCCSCFFQFASQNTLSLFGVHAYDICFCKSFYSLLSPCFLISAFFNYKDFLKITRMSKLCNFHFILKHWCWANCSTS